MSNSSGYLAILTAIVQRQFGILGAEKALNGASHAGLEVIDDGVVATFVGDGNNAVKNLIDCYVGYAGLTAKIGCISLAKKIAGENGITLSNL